MIIIDKHTIIKKKILVFFPSYIQKSQSFIIDQIQGLSSHYEILIYTFNKDYKENHFVVESTKIIYDERFSKLYNKEKYPYLDRYNEQEKRLHIYFLKSLSEYIKKEKIDTILCQFLSDSVFISDLKIFSKNISIVTMCRGRDIYCEFPLLQNSQKAKLRQNINHFFVRDQSMFNKAIDYNFGKKQLHISNTGKIIGKYNFHQKDFSNIRILFGGRIVEKKGIIETLDFLEEILRRKQISIEKIILLGDCNGKDTYSLQVKDRINGSKLLSQYVKYVGFLGHDEYLSTIHDKVNVFIGHYKISEDNDQDGIPNVLLENMLVGNLCFSTMSGGISEVMIEGQTGYVLTGEQNHDILKFEQKIGETHIHMLQNTREFIEQKFDIDKELKQLIKYL